jgi:hypothetical protein
MSLTKLTEDEFIRISKLHDKVFIGGEVDENNFEIFKEIVLMYEQTGKNVDRFKRYIKLYEKVIRNGN